MSKNMKPTIVTISEDMQSLIDEIIDETDGDVYKSVEEMVLDGLCLLKTHHEAETDKLAASLKESCDAADRGEVIDFEDMVNELEEGPNKLGRGS